MSRMEPWVTPMSGGHMENKKPKKVTGKKVREVGESGASCVTEIKRKREH